MMKSSSETLLMRAARGEQTQRTPIWLMRQAGRTDPEYRRIRKENDITLEDLFRHPELAAEISLLPVRIGVDAVIIFQDILTPLTPMGADFRFSPGPVLSNKLSNRKQIESLHEYDAAKELTFVPEILERIGDILNGRLPVIGFAGAPMTLAIFLIHGKSPGNNANMFLNLIEKAPDTVHRLLDKLTIVTIKYLELHIDAGVSLIQLFESCAYLVPESIYREYALPYQQKIFKALANRVPKIIFARKMENLKLLDDSCADIISLPSSITIQSARKVLGNNRVFQGNLSSSLLCKGTREDISAATTKCIADGESRGHILNLDQGLSADTPFENIIHLINTVKRIGSL